MALSTRQRGRAAFGCSAGAIVWAVAVIAAAVLLPAYTSESSISAGGVASTRTSTSTLVGQNGTGLLVLICLPAVVAVLVGGALRRKCSVAGSRSSGGVAWVLIGLLVAFSLLAILSIGLFVLPVALLLAAAASLTPPARLVEPGPPPRSD